MYDCPNCRVPLHGHEEVCPSCGAKQLVRRDFSKLAPVPGALGVNWVPVVIFFLLVGFGIYMAAQSTWIGQLLKQGPPPADPLAKLTYLDARKIVEQKLSQGLAEAGANGKFTWTAADDGQPADESSPKDVHLAINTRLKDPLSRQAIIDPIKPYMGKAKITTLVMRSTRGGQTREWTYSLQPSTSLSQEQIPSFDSFENEEKQLQQQEASREQKQQATRQIMEQETQQPAPANKQPGAQPATNNEQQPVQQQPDSQQTISPANQQPAGKQPANQQSQQQNPWDAEPQSLE